MLDIISITDIDLSEALVDKTYIVDKEVASLEGDMLWSLCKRGVSVVEIMEKYNIDFGNILVNYSKLAGLKTASPDEFSFGFNKKAYPIFRMIGNSYFNKNMDKEFEEVIIKLLNKGKLNV